MANPLEKVMDDFSKKIGKKAKMSGSANYIDRGCAAYEKVIQENPQLAGPSFEEYVVVHNRADRDSGELSDIAEQEVRRLAAAYQSAAMGVIRTETDFQTTIKYESSLV